MWGDQWTIPLGQLTATLTLPGEATGAGPLRAWGHPVWVRGDVTLEASRVLLRALAVPAKQFVELRVVFPRALLDSTAGARVEDGRGLEAILVEEEQDAMSYERDRERIDSALRNIGRTILYLLLLGVGPALFVIGAAYRLFGRELRTGYDREYEQEPPSELEPALVPTLLGQGGTAGSYEFTATLFDLIRRGRYASKPVTTERGAWGGLRSEEVADLELTLGEAIPLTPFEQSVDDVVAAVLDDGPERLSRFRARIASNRTANANRFSAFKAAIGAEAKTRRWFVNSGRPRPRGSGSPCSAWPRSSCSGSGSPASARSLRAGATSS